MPASAFPYALHCPAMFRKSGVSTAGASIPESAMRMHRGVGVAPFSAHFHRSTMARDVRGYAQMPDQAEAPPGLRPRPLKRPPPAKVRKENQPASHLLYEVIDAEGQTHNVKPSQVVVVLPGKGYTTEDLKKITSQAAEAPHSAMVELWEKMVGEALQSTRGRTLASDPNNHHDVLELSKRLWGDSSAANLYTTHRLLREDDVYFYRLKTRPPTFHVRSKTEVERLVKQKQLEAEQAEQRKVVTGVLRAALESPKSQKEWQEGPHSEALALIESFARGQTGAPHGTALFALLDVGLPATPDGAAQLLKQIRGQVQQDFPEYVEQLCGNIVAAVEGGEAVKDGLARTDYVDSPAIAIDDITTLDVDDAVSVEAREGGGWRVAVHVADPAAYVSAGDPLDVEALTRGRTLYLPWGKVPMFPLELSDGVFSLNPDKFRNCLTFYATLAKDGSLEEFDVKAHRVKCTRMTYDDVDAVMASSDGKGTDAQVHESLQRLCAASRARTKLREQSECAPIVNMNCLIHVKDVESEHPEISVKAVAVHESESRAAVMEMMVLAGQVAAKWACKKGVPVLFRYQEAPSPPTPEQLARLSHSQLAQSYLWRTRMLKSGTTADLPRRHHGLGIDAYCQVTSPIRRYTDLLCHYQIKAALREKEAPLTAACLERASKRFDDAVRRHRSIENESLNHFLAMYCERKPGHVYSAEVLGINKDGAAVLQITDIGLERTVLLSRPTFPGRKVSLRAVPDRMAGTVTWQEA